MKNSYWQAHCPWVHRKSNNHFRLLYYELTVYSTVLYVCQIILIDIILTLGDRIFLSWGLHSSKWAHVYSFFSNDIFACNSKKNSSSPFWRDPYFFKIFRRLEPASKVILAFRMFALQVFLFCSWMSVIGRMSIFPSWCYVKLDLCKIPLFLFKIQNLHWYYHHF